MNKQRREALDKAHTKLMTLVADLEEVMIDLENICEEEQEAFDNLPESLQGSERGERMSEIIETFEEADSTMCDAKDNLEEVLGELWDIINE